MMRPISLAAVASACGVAWDKTDILFSGVCTDSRTLQPGDLFVALRGERFDAHDFLALVEKNGAVAAVVEKTDPAVSMSQLQVVDTISALGKLAALNRAFFHGKTIGLTGSAGKTTTKEMIAAILAQHGSPLVTAGNLNNHLGVPITLLRLSPENDSAVIEMGASAVNEIRYLTGLAKPDVALVTNVAPAHLEGFGTIENVAKGKREIFEGLPDNGTAIINLDNEWTASWNEDLASRFHVLTYSMCRAADISASRIVQSADGVSFDLHIANTVLPINLSFLGEHNVGNALAAAACCMALGVSPEDIASGLRLAKPYKGRLQSKRGMNDCLVIDDSYNANPASMRMAIDALMAREGKKILVLGDMGELGADASELHAGVGAYAKAAGVETLLATGVLCRAATERFGEGALWFESRELLASHCLSQAASDSVFLVKGSRSAGMEQVADALVNARGIAC